jgi:hypothetical protein
VHVCVCACACMYVCIYVCVSVRRGGTGAEAELCVVVWHRCGDPSSADTCDQRK